MKKKLVILLLLLVTVVLLFAACGEDKHVHDYGTLIAKVDATCTEAGTIAHYHCDGCGKDFDENKDEVTDLTIPAGHDVVDVPATPASCTKEGKTAGKICSVCRTVIVAQETIPASHTFGDWVEEKAATCTARGTKGYYVCTVCNKKFDADGKELKSIYTQATGHSGEWITDVAATCTTDGHEYRDCDVCGAHEEKTITASHTFGEWEEVAATCTTAGIQGHYHCSVCGKDFDKRNNEIANVNVAALGHNYGKWISATPNCEEAGTLGHYHCSLCGKDFDRSKTELATIVVPQSETGHNYGEEIAEKPASCADGVRAHYECSVCHKYFVGENKTPATSAELVIPATGEHNYGFFIRQVAPTATADGTKGHYHCSVCDKYFDADKNEITNLTLHNYEKRGGYREIIYEGGVPTGVTPLSEATAEEHYYCKVCDKLYNLNDEVITENDLTTETRIAIRNNTDMQALATLVNEGNTFAGETFALLANVDLTVAIGDENHPFSGSFDGQNHTVTITQSFTDTKSTGGLFSFVRVPENGTVTIGNVKVTGTITMRSSTNDKTSTIGGLISVCDAGGNGNGGTLNITNCWSNVRFEADGTNDGGRVQEIGGFIGFINHKNGFLKPLTINMDSCLWDGVIYGSAAIDSVGGFIGYTGQNKDNRIVTINITNSVSAGTIHMEKGWSGDSGVCLVVGNQKGNYTESGNTQTGITTINVKNMIVCGKITTAEKLSKTNYGVFRKSGDYAKLNLENLFYVETGTGGFVTFPIVVGGTANKTTNVKSGTAVAMMVQADMALLDGWTSIGDYDYLCPASIVESFGAPTTLHLDVDYDLSDTITIGSDEAMAAFAESVNNGKNYKGKTVVLTADVKLNTTIGATSSKPFSGNFNGQGHTVTLAQSIKNPDGDGGLFSFIRVPEDGTVTIKNVHVTGTIGLNNDKANMGYVGALVSAVDANKSGNGGTINITNVWSSVTINAGANNAWTSLSGLVGFLRHDDGLKQITINIDSCLWDGIINAGPAIYHAGGFLGYTGNNKVDRQPVINITNSVAAGSFQTNIDKWNQQFGTIASYLKGSYKDDATAKVTVNVENVISVVKATFVKPTGSESTIGLIEEVNGTTELNLTNVYYIPFERTGMTGTFPVVAAGTATTSTNVLVKDVDGLCALTTADFTNAAKWTILDGFNYPCPKGIYDTFGGQPESLIVNEYEYGYDTQDTFEIASAAELVRFRNAVNNGYTFSGKTVKLTANIDLEGIAWKEIGRASGTSSVGGKVFQGTFDGQNYTISNMTTYLEPLSGYVDMQGGLFGNLGDGAVVKNFNLTGSMTIYNRSSNNTGTSSYFGSIANAVSGTVTIQNIHSSVNITTKNGKNPDTGKWAGGVSYAAGLVGFILHNNDANLTIDNCEYSGTINCANNATGTAGIISFTGNNGNGSTKILTITNTVFSGTIYLNDNGGSYAYERCGGILGCLGDYAKLTISNTTFEGDFYFNRSKAWSATNISVGQIIGRVNSDATYTIGSDVTYKPIYLYTDLPVSDENKFVLGEIGYNANTSTYTVDTDAQPIEEQAPASEG